VNPTWADRFLSETDIAEHDPKSGEPIAWGRRVIEEIPEDLFDDLKARCEMACIFPDWYLVEKRVQFADLMMKHGGVRFVGLGPGGGFKWVRFADGSTWGHSSWRTGALAELHKRPRMLVKCDKEGNEENGGPRIPRVAKGRSSKPRGPTRRPGR